MGTEGHTRQVGVRTATLLVVATMVGTGIFTTTGFLIRDVQSAPAVLLLWVLGGLFALCGALCYAELTAALPRNGGDYHLLSRVFHPAAGFVAGWVSLIGGFAAPIAAASLAFGQYLQPIFPGVDPVFAAITVTVVLSLVHAYDVKGAARTQDVVTIPKIVLIVLLILGGLFLGQLTRIGWSPRAVFPDAVVEPSFAVSLVYVFYAYSGWNGAAYIAGEVRRPEQNLHRALLGGTFLVTALYVGINAALLAAAPAETLAGVEEVVAVAATHAAGPTAGRLVALIIAIGLVSAVGAMVMAGPRVYATMGEDYRALRFLSRRTQRGAPASAVLFQGAIAVALVLVADLDAIFVYVGLTLSMVSALTVLGVIVLRVREPALPRPIRTWGYPLTPLVFIGLMGWMMRYTLEENPKLASASLLTIASGLVLYGLCVWWEKR